MAKLLLRFLGPVIFATLLLLRAKSWTEGLVMVLAVALGTGIALLLHRLWAEMKAEQAEKNRERR